MHFGVAMMHDPCAVSSATRLKQLLICIFVQEGRVCPWVLYCLCIQLLCSCSLNNYGTEVQDSWLRNPQLGTAGTKNKSFASVPKLRQLFCFFLKRSE